jgi:hypothetical protein
MIRLFRNLWLWTLPLALLLSLGGCELKCSADADNDVEDVVEEAGDDIEEFSEEVEEDLEGDGSQ